MYVSACHTLTTKSLARVVVTDGVVIELPPLTMEYVEHAPTSTGLVGAFPERQNPVM